ncbi:hypothetical protein pb186bvf_009327 [Paramecium bursaria]
MGQNNSQEFTFSWTKQKLKDMINNNSKTVRFQKYLLNNLKLKDSNHYNKQIQKDYQFKSFLVNCQVDMKSIQFQSLYKQLQQNQEINYEDVNIRYNNQIQNKEYDKILAQIFVHHCKGGHIIIDIIQFINAQLFKQKELYDSQMIDEVLKFVIQFTSDMFNQLYQGLLFDINLLGQKIIQTLVFNRTKVQEHYFKQLKIQPQSILQIERIQQSKTPEDLFQEISQYFNFNNYSLSSALEQIQQYPQKLHLKCQLYIILQFKYEPGQQISFVQDLYNIVIKFDPNSIQNTERIVEIIDQQLSQKKFQLPEIEAFKVEMKIANMNMALMSEQSLGSDILQSQIIYHLNNQQIYKYRFQQLMEDIREKRVKQIEDIDDPLKQKLNQILVSSYQDNRHPAKFVISQFIMETIANCYENREYKLNLLTFIVNISYKIFESAIVKDLRQFQLNDGELKIIIYHIVQIIIFNFSHVRALIDMEDESHQILAPIEMFYYILDSFEKCQGNDQRVENVTFEYHMLEKDEKFKLNQYQEIIKQWLPLDIFEIQKINDYEIITNSILRYNEIH